MKTGLRVKICGITQVEQGRTIARLGATALGLMCVQQSPRYVSVEQIRVIVEAVRLDMAMGGRECDLVGVFLDASLEEICSTVNMGQLNSVQLHGSESTKVCQQLRRSLPGIEVIKAVRVRSAEDLQRAIEYEGCVDALLLDAYHPKLAGGTGKTLDWSKLHQFQPDCPWFLAGGLTPDNIAEALSQLQPHGVDLSSGVERSPGDKNLDEVARLFERLRAIGAISSKLL